MNIGVVSNLLKENYINNNKTLGTSLEKLSSGLKINKASDNASGLAISDKLRTQASGIKQGIDNANSALAMLNIADKSMSELSSILDTIKAKAVQMNTDTTSDEGRKILKTDILKLIDSYDNIVRSTNYNQTPLLDGSSTPFDFQVGDNSNDIISVDVTSVESTQMGQADPYKLKNFITGFNTIPTKTVATTTTTSTTTTNPAYDISTVFPSYNNVNYDTPYNMGDLKNYISYYTLPPGNNFLDEDLISNTLTIFSGTDPLGLLDVSVTINADNFLTNATSNNPYSTLTTGTYFPKNQATKDYFDALAALDDAINGLSSGQVEHFFSPTLGDYYKTRALVSYNGPLIDENSPSILLQKQVLSFSVTSYTHDINSSFSALFPSMENVIIEDLIALKKLPEYDNNGIITNFNLDISINELQIANFGNYIVHIPSSDSTMTNTSTTYTTVTDYDAILERNDDNPNLKIQSQNLMNVIDEALNQLNTQRGNIGSGINQLESSAKNHMTNYVNIKNAESIIRDVDYADESSNFNKANIIVQAGSYVQSQANEIDKQSISQLLK